MIESVIAACIAANNRAVRRSPIGCVSSRFASAEPTWVAAFEL